MASGEAAGQNALSAATTTEASTNLATDGDNHADGDTEHRNTEDDECRLHEKNHQGREEQEEGGGDEYEYEYEYEEQEQGGEQDNNRQEKEHGRNVTLEAAAFYLYANNPQSLDVDARGATDTELSQDEMDDNDRGLQEALSLSLREVATLGVDQ